ncbi:hypothetical protein [Actinomadura geliboluensis]|uniref:hypothetical protein n=1 Tax=Actinomadura geliboluensis TaxID=882440 RepID=UPI00371CAC96
MDERVMLLLVQHLFPEWTIGRDGHGIWRAVGRSLVSATELDGLLDALGRADPDAVRRAVLVLTECG